jgi:catechol 2,3-dioxygenase-like lactoylglutathione lyase family enzyme
MKAGYSTPMLQVASVDRSIQFYGRLGFELVDVHGTPGDLGWARMHCEGGAIMFVASDEPAGAQHVGFLLYLYTPNLPALRTELTTAGIDVSPIEYPDHLPSGEVCLTDPDGYDVFIGHWGEQEQGVWQREREKKRAAGLIP